MTFNISSKYKKNVSGYFFFERLFKKLSKSKYYDLNSTIVLVNVSISLIEIVRLKLQNKKIVIRLDGAYHDHLNFLEENNNFFLRFFGSFFGNFFIFNYLYNLYDQNWKVELRLVFCKAIIYQSLFSKNCHKYFLFNKNKPNIVISNSYLGKLYQSNGKKVLIVLGNSRRKNDKQSIDLALKYCLNHDKTLKIIGWPSNTQNFLGFNKTTLESTGRVLIFGRYQNLFDLKKLVEDCKYFVFLSFRDPCPNILLELISLGLKPITLKSGGTQEILSFNYPMIEINDSFGFFSPCRFSYKFDKINYKDFKKVFDLVRQIELKDVRKDHLQLDNITQQYESFLNGLSK